MGRERTARNAVETNAGVAPEGAVPEVGNASKLRAGKRARADAGSISQVANVSVEPCEKSVRTNAEICDGMPEFGDIVSVMSRTLGAVNRRLVELMEREGLAGIVPSHGDILMQLFAHGSMPMAALASGIGKDPSTVTALVRKLEQAGYVEKLPSPKDRRMNEVRLTARGRKLEGAMGRISTELIAGLTRGIDGADLKTTRKCLLAMQANLNNRLNSGENE